MITSLSHTVTYPWDGLFMILTVIAYNANINTMVEKRHFLLILKCILLLLMKLLTVTVMYSNHGM